MCTTSNEYNNDVSKSCALCLPCIKGHGVVLEFTLVQHAVPCTNLGTCEVVRSSHGGKTLRNKDRLLPLQLHSIIFTSTSSRSVNPYSTGKKSSSSPSPSHSPAPKSWRILASRSSSPVDAVALVKLS